MSLTKNKLPGGSDVSLTEAGLKATTGQGLAQGASSCAL